MNTLNNYMYSSYKNDMPINESQFFIKNGRALDSLFAKMETYNTKMSSRNFVFEGASEYDIALNFDESVAAKDLLMLTLESYVKQLLIEAEVITEDEINEGITDIFRKAKEVATDATAKLKDGMEWVKDKLKALWEFIKKIKENAFKTIKDVALSIVEMMCTIGGAFGDMLEKLKVETKGAQTALLAKIKEAFKSKDVKTNIFSEGAQTGYYSNLGKMFEHNESAANEFIINEWNLFKKKEKTPEEGGNEYDKAKDAKAGEDKFFSNSSWAGVISKAVALTLIQLFAYSFVCVLMPAIVTLIGGPLAGAIAESLSKILWSSGVVFYQIRTEVKLHKSGEFEKKYNTKWKKAIHWIFFLMNIMWAAWKAISGFIEAAKIFDAFFSGQGDSVFPSDAVTNLAGKLNEYWKSLTGSDTSGWEKMQEAINKTQEQFIEEAQKIGMSAEDAKEAFNSGDWKNSLKAIKELQEKGISADQVKDLADGDKVTVLLNGFFDPEKNKWSKDLLSAWKQYGGSDDELKEILKQGSNAVLHGVNKNAGAMTAGEFPAEFIKMCMNKNIPLGHDGMSAFMGAVKTVSKVVPGIETLKNHFDFFGGFFALPSFVKAKENNWFLLRVGSAKSPAKLYDIQDCKEYTYAEAEKEYKELNPDVFNDMRKIIEANNKILQNMQVKESKDDVVDDKLEYLKKTEKGKNVLVLFGKRYKPSKKQKTNKEQVKESLYDTLYITEADNTNEENQQEEEKLVPVVVLNNLLMCAGDLLNGWTDKNKKMRKHAIYYRGFQGGYEIIPKDGGMSESEIKEWINELLKASFSACYNINPVPPCYKKLGKWKLNEKAPSGQREDFGNFSNEELLEIAQGKSDLTKYMMADLYSSRHKSGGHRTLEQDDTEFAKKQREGALKNMKKDMQSKKVQDVLEKYPNLKKKLMNDDGSVNDEEFEKISNHIMRIEKTFDKGPQKKTAWSKIKSWFKGDNQDNNDNLEGYKPEEIRDLSYALHSAAKNRKSKKNESIEDDEYNAFDFADCSFAEIANLNEFLEWFESEDDTIFESESELKPAYSSLSKYIKRKQNI